MENSYLSAGGGATSSNLSTPQKMLATLLSIILVVGLSPFGQAPAKAWATPANADSLNKQLDSNVALLTMSGSSTKYYYDNLDVALSDAAANSGSTIKLLKDATLQDTMDNGGVVEVDGSFTLDLATFTLTFPVDGDSADPVALSLTSGASTMKNGKIDVKDTDNDAAAITVDGASTSLALEGVAFTGAEAFLAETDGASVTSTGTSYDFTQSASTDLNENDAIINVAGSSFTMPTGSLETVYTEGGFGGIAATAGAEVTLGTAGSAAPTFTTQASAVDATGIDGAVTEVSVLGGVYNNQYAVDASIPTFKANTYAEVTISGGAVTGANFAAGTANAATSKLNVSGGTLKSAAGTATFNLGVASLNEISGGTIGKEGDTDILAAATTAGCLVGGNAYQVKPINGIADGYAAKGTYNATTEDYTDAPWSILKTLAGTTVETEDLVYTRAAQTPSTTVYWPEKGADNEAELAAGTDYQVSYYKMAADGTVAGTVTYDDGEGYTFNGAGAATLTDVAAAGDAAGYVARVQPVEGSAAWTGEGATDYGTAGGGLISVVKGDLATMVKNSDESENPIRVLLSTDGTTWSDYYDFEAAFVNADTAIHPKVKLEIAGVPFTETQTVNSQSVTNFTIDYGDNNTVGADAGTVTLSVVQDNDASVLAADQEVEFEFAITGASSLSAVSFGSTTSKALSLAASPTPTAERTSVTLPKVTNAKGTTLTLGTHYKLSVTAPDGSTTEVAYNTASDGDDVSTNVTAGLTEVYLAKGAGVYTFTATGIAAGGYSADDSVSGTFTVTGVDISSTANATFTLANFTDGSANYSAAGISTAMSTAKFKNASVAGGTELALRAGTDYTVSPSKVTEPGTHTITVTGINDFTGSQTITVNVVAKSFAGVKAAANGTYAGAALDAPALTFYDTADIASTTEPLADNPLTEGTDYTVKFYKPGTTTEVEAVDAGTYTLVATGIGAYDGSSATCSWTVDPGKLADFVDEVEINNDKPFKFTGEAVDISGNVVVTAEVGDDVVTLAEGTDYTIPESTFTKSGTAVIYGAGNFSGSIQAPVEFDSASLYDAATATASAMTFKPGTGAGVAQAPAITVTNKVNGEELVLGDDYEFVGVYAAATFDASGKPLTYDEETDVLDGGKLTNAGYYKAVLAGADGSNYDAEYSSSLNDPATIAVEFQIAPFDLSTLGAAALTSGDALVDDELGFTGAQYAVMTNGNEDYKLDLTNGDKTITLTQQVDNDATSEVLADQFVTKGIESVGKSYVTVAGINNYTGSITTPLQAEVTKADLSDATIQFEAAKDVWVTGNAVTANFAAAIGATPNVRVVMLDADGAVTYTFKKDSDYTVAYANNSVASDEAKVTVTAVASSSVAKADTTNSALFKTTATTLASMTASYVLNVSHNGGTAAVISTIAYDGKNNAVTPQITGVAGSGYDGTGETFQCFKDDETEPLAAYDALVDAGTYRFVATNPLYAGTIETTLTITPVSLATLTGDILYTDPDGDEGQPFTYGSVPEYAYTGSAIDPAFAIDDLTEGEDYTVTYSDDVTNLGTATATLTGIGNYSGTLTIGFKIVAADFDEQYQVYQFVDPSYATSTVNRTPSYIDDVETPYWSSAYAAYPYLAGKAVEPKIVVANKVSAAGDKFTKQLTEGVDYTLEYNRNDVTGTATVYVLPINPGFTGYVAGTFTISPIALDGTRYGVTAAVADHKYGETPKASVTYTVDGAQYSLEEGADFKVAYAADNPEIGDCSATFIGIANMAKLAQNATGTARASYKVTKGETTVTLANKTVTYNGKAQAIGAAKVTGSDGAVTYKYFSDAACTKAATPTNAGTYYATATVAANDKYEGKTSNVAKLTVNKAANTMKVTYKKKTQAVTSKKAKTFTAAKAFKFTNKSVSNGKYAFSKKSGNKKITINKTTGKITVKKGLKKGKTYTAKFYVQQKAGTNYAASAKKVVTIKFKVTK